MPQDCRAMILDVKRAFLYGERKRDIYIEFPPEDPMYGKGFLGRLRKAMYGTRDAPQVWQETVRRVMKSLGYESSRKIPCVYFPKDRKVWVMAHVDYFLVIGPSERIKVLRSELAKEFELKSKILGPSHGEVNEVTFLGRRVCWTRRGITLEGDHQHIDKFVKELGLEGAKAMSTPVVSGKKRLDQDTELLTGDDLKMYRSAAARTNYIGLDRMDMSYAGKEAARCLANPSRGDAVRLKRVGRYLVNKPRCEQLLPWQEMPCKILAYTDSDWGGCPKTRKSTSRGVLLFGNCCLSHWSKTQAAIALSSGKAELNALTKGLSESLEAFHLLEEGSLYLEKGIIRCTDSTAASGTAHRWGAGRIKHLELRQPWIKQYVSTGKVKVHKAPRAANPSDTLTHALWSRCCRTVQAVRIYFRTARTYRRGLRGGVCGV